MSVVDLTPPQLIAVIVQLFIKLVREQWCFADLEQHIAKVVIRPFDAPFLKYESARFVIQIRTHGVRAYYVRDAHSAKRTFRHRKRVIFELLLHLDSRTHFTSNMVDLLRHLYQEFYDVAPTVSDLVQFRRCVDNAFVVDDDEQVLQNLLLETLDSFVKK